MNILNRIFGKKRNYEVVTINNLPQIEAVKFKVYNPIEKIRTQDFGNEKDSLEYFLSILKKDDVVFDVGASVGLFTITSAKKLQNGKIYSFEPDNETFHRLNENIQFNNLQNIYTYQMALSDSAGTIDLFTDGTNGFAPTMKFQKNRKGAPQNKIQVKADSLDNLVETGVVPFPNIIKIDIEGAEAFCLKGAQKLLSGKLGKKPENLFVELHPEFLPDFDSSAEELNQFILDNGYEIVWSEKRDKQEHFHYRLLN